jgi:ketosteroid isomerase-like protein
VHRQPGHNQTSGEYKGVDDVIAFYGRLFELSSGTLQLELKSVKTSGGKVVSVHGIKAQRDGKSLDADESIEFTLEGDKISRLDVTYLDEAVFDAFWGKA